MLDAYRSVFGSPGALRFSAAGLWGRLPLSTIGLGIVLLLSDVQGSYGLAGLVSGVYITANAVAAIPLGRIIDHWGQTRVLPLTIMAFSIAMSLLAWAAMQDQPAPLLFALAAVGGATLPPVGSCVRARWSHALADEPHKVHTAYAVESVIDEAVFIVGPVAATVLATSLHPTAGVLLGVTSGLVGTLWLTSQRRTAPAPGRSSVAAAHRSVMPWSAVLAVGGVAIALGGIFGTVEVVTVAFAEEHDIKSWSGVFLGLWSLGSLLAGLVAGALTWRSAPATRLRIGMAALAATTTPLPWVDAPVALGVVLVVSGLAIAPTLIAATTHIERVVPGPRLTEGFAVLHTGLAAGVAVGAALAGIVIDDHGANAAYLVTVAAGLTGIIGSMFIHDHPTRAHPGGSHAAHIRPVAGKRRKVSP